MFVTSAAFVSYPLSCSAPGLVQVFPFVSFSSFFDTIRAGCRLNSPTLDFGIWIKMPLQANRLESITY